MSETDPGNTLALEYCWDCRLELRARDRFCRNCGANLSRRTGVLNEEPVGNARQVTNQTASPYATAPFAVQPHRPVSAPLLNFFAASAAPNAAVFQRSRLAKLLTLLLISLPIWLMMILLSPLDAYAATKAIAKQV